MFWKNKNEIVLGKIRRELRLRRRFGFLRWHWQRRMFRSMRLDLHRSMNQHMMITGESGAGKSNVAKLILEQLAEQGACFVVLDPHAEYAEHARNLHAKAYDASMHAVNPFDLDGLSERERTSEVTAMFRRILHLGEVQASTLYRCISYTYWAGMRKEAAPNMHSLLYTIKVFKRHARSKPEQNMLESLEKRLLIIAGEGYARSVPIDSIMNGRSVFSLQALHSAEAQAVYMESMLRKIYSGLLAGGNAGSNKGFFIVIDEASRLQESPVIARLVAEGRKYGVGIIAIAQRAKALDKEIRSNAATIIAFAQREPEEQSYVANMIAAGSEYNRFLEVRKAMRELPRGWALVQEGRERSPKMIRCNRFSAKARDPSGRIMEAAKKVVGKRELIERLAKEGFAEEETLAAVKALIDVGLLEYHVVTEEPYQGTWFIAMPRNSAKHDVMVGLIGRYLAERGIGNRIYNTSYGPDLIAYVHGKRVAIEYETGTKRAEETRRMLADRMKKFDSVLVLGNSGSAGEKT